MEGSDIVNAVIEESITMNIVIYIVMMIFTTMLVSYAVYLSWKIVTNGRQSLNNLSLTPGYEPVAQSWIIIIILIADVGAVVRKAYCQILVFNSKYTSDMYQKILQQKIFFPSPYRR